MKKEEAYKILQDMSRNVNSSEYAEEYDSSEIQYIKKNIREIKNALEDGTLNPENLTSDLLYEFINDGLDLSAIQPSGDTITPDDAVKAALKSPPTAEEIQMVNDEKTKVEDKKLEDQNIE